MTDNNEKPKFRERSNLTSKQKEDINFAILEYLMKNNFEESVKTFSKEADIDYDEYLKTTTQPKSLLKDVLERKWTSLAR